MGIESLLIAVQIRIDQSKVEAQHQVPGPLGRGMAVDVEPLVPVLESVGLLDVVVVSEHGERQALAEAPRTDVEKEAVGLLNLFDVAGLIHVVTVVSQHTGEVHDPVGNALARGRGTHRPWCYWLIHAAKVTLFRQIA